MLKTTTVGMMQKCSSSPWIDQSLPSLCAVTSNCSVFPFQKCEVYNFCYQRNFFFEFDLFCVLTKFLVSEFCVHFCLSDGSYFCSIVATT